MQEAAATATGSFQQLVGDLSLFPPFCSSLSILTLCPMDRDGAFHQALSWPARVLLAAVQEKPAADRSPTLPTQCA